MGTLTARIGVGRMKDIGWWAAVVIAAVCSATFASMASTVGAEPTLISIDTGDKTGVYYPTGGAICSAVNAHRTDHGIRCLAQKSKGSIDNLTSVRSGDATLGIVQSDWHYHAVRGTGVFEDTGADRSLRSLFSLFPEPFTVVAHPDAGIGRFADLKGKRVNVGAAGSGSRATMNVIMEAMGWTEADFAASSLATNALPRALCGGEIDAAVFIIGHPNRTVEEMITSCDASLVPVEGAVIDRLVAENSYYFELEIPAKTYPGQTTTIPVFALGATLVTSSRTARGVVYELVKAVFENFDAFRASHPVLAGLEKVRMISDGLTAPFHSGALRYFEEVGLR